MNHAAAVKYVNILDPVSDSSTLAVDNAVDTAGYSYLTVVVSTGASSGMTALKLQESDAGNMSGATDVAGTAVGTALDIDGGTSTLPSASNDEIHVINLDLRGHKRYVSVAGTYGGATLCSMLGILSKAAEATNVLADRGVNTMVDA